MVWVKRATVGLLLLFTVAVLGITAFLFIQAQKKPDTNAYYVALGSSYAAGLGLGESADGTPLVCQRTIKSYSQQLARMLKLSLTDMSCSGAKTRHVVHGGQFFLGPQIDAIGPQTRLVTLTVGGNDVGYVGDLTMMAFRNRGGLTGWLISNLTSEASPVEDRDFKTLKSDLVTTLRELSRRAPRAKIIVVTYPTILPARGTCENVGVNEAQAALIRSVGNKLAVVTREAAQETGATLVDMATLSINHDACSAVAWVNGASPEDGAIFHPSEIGANATAKAILGAITRNAPAMQ